MLSQRDWLLWTQPAAARLFLKMWLPRTLTPPSAPGLPLPVSICLQSSQEGDRREMSGSSSS